MTIQKPRTDAAQSIQADIPHGNAEAAIGAAKSKAALEAIMGPAVTPKLSELPTTKERLLAVADAIERAELAKQNIGFNMQLWYDVRGTKKDHISETHQTNSCGTVACAAGWTVLLEDGPGTRWSPIGNGANGSMMTRAIEILGIPYMTAHALFSGGSSRSLSNLTDKQAVATIRYLAETGEVAWHLFDANGNPKK